MEFSIAAAQDKFSELIRAVEEGEQIVITRDGKPVAQLTAPPSERRKARLGEMKDRIQLLPGWDDPITLDELIGEDDSAAR